jgi:hypothetical protein
LKAVAFFGIFYLQVDKEISEQSLSCISVGKVRETLVLRQVFGASNFL